MVRKFKINGEELNFRMSNRTIFIIDEKYDNFGDVVNGVMYGKNLYNNALKIIECSCISSRVDEFGKEKTLTLEELEESLTPIQITKEIVPFATQLYLDYIGVKKTSEPQDHKEKQNKKK